MEGLQSSRESPSPTAAGNLRVEEQQKEEQLERALTTLKSHHYFIWDCLCLKSCVPRNSRLGTKVDIKQSREGAVSRDLSTLLFVKMEKKVWLI